MLFEIACSLLVLANGAVIGLPFLSRKPQIEKVQSKNIIDGIIESVLDGTFVAETQNEGRVYQFKSSELQIRVPTNYSSHFTGQPDSANFHVKILKENEANQDFYSHLDVDEHNKIMNVYAQYMNNKVLRALEESKYNQAIRKLEEHND